MKDKSVILVVDDQPENTELLEAHLVPQGYEVVKAASGEEALKILSGNQIDLVLLDIMMPRMSGFEVLEKIRADKKTRLIPVVMVTALKETEDRIKALEARCDDFISKPFDRHELLARVKSLLRIKSLHNEVEEARKYAENIINTVREPLIVLDQDLRVVSVNRSFYGVFKVKPEETVGQLIYDLGNKQWDIPKLRELLETILPEKTSFDNYEVEHDFATIGNRTMLLNARQIKRVLGKKRIILLAIEDITKRKQLENLLIESETQYRRLFETASDGIVLLEKREGKVIHANPATEKLLGYTEKESIGNSLQDIGVVLDTSDFQTIIQNLNESGILNYRNVKVETKSGKCIDTEIYLVDRAKLVQCNIRDITERKWVKEALRESEERFRNYIERAPDGVFIVDDTGQYLECNKSAARIIGYSEEEIKKMSIRDLLAEESLEEGVAHFNKLMETGAAESDLWHKHKNGSKRCLTVNAVKLSETRVLGFCKDITEQKKAEESLKKTLESLRKAVGATIQVMVSAVEARDPYTAGHQLRVADLARTIATEMGLSKDRIEGIRIAGSIHDIGKLSIPSEILSKPAKLSDIEFSLIKEHSRSGYEILKNVESPWPLAEIVYQHHERMDGSGYPRNLKGEEILMEARIMAVTDVVEAMASHRPYRPALGIDAAMKEIEDNRGILYDADVVDVCLRLFRKKDWRF